MKWLLIAGIVIVLVLLFSLLPTPDEQLTKPTLDEVSEEQTKAPVFSSLSDNFVLTNVQIFDGNNVLGTGTVIVDNQRLIISTEDNVSLPTNIPVVAADGMTIMPLLIDAHTHNWGDASKQALNFGVGTELDMFTAPASAKPHFAVRDDSRNTEQADLFSATILATAPGGHGTQFGMDIPTLTETSQVADFVARRVADGADYIKAVYFSKASGQTHFNSISYEILQALAEQAKAHDKLLVVHIDDLPSAKEAVKAGADGLIHAFTDRIVDDELIDLMQQNDVFITPTFSVIASASQMKPGQFLLNNPVNLEYLTQEQQNSLSSSFPFFGLNKANYANAKQSILTLHEAGIVVLAGSDAPNPGTAHGVSLHGELVRLVEAGLTPLEALHAATGAVNSVLPVGERGTLVNGGYASMLLVDGNPLIDIEATQNIKGIWKYGKALQRYSTESEMNSDSRVIKTGLISDFERGISPPHGPIVVSTDAMMSGKSVGTVVPATEDGNSYVQFDGEIIPGFMYPWTGVSILLGRSANEIVDLSQLRSISFTAKSTSKNKIVNLMLIQQDKQMPSLVAIQLTDSWREYRITLDDFRGVDLTRIANLSLVFMTEPGTYNMLLDDLRFQ